MKSMTSRFHLVKHNERDWVPRKIEEGNHPVHDDIVHGEIGYIGVVL